MKKRLQQHFSFEMWLFYFAFLTSFLNLVLQNKGNVIEQKKDLST